jgi:lysozyme
VGQDPDAIDTDQVARRRRRWPLPVAAALVALVAVGAWGWFVRLPGYRPALRPGERYGVDVSHHQGEIDWRQVAGDDIEFAYIKASEGGDLVDRRFQDNWDGAGAAGLDRGAYHFFTLCRSGAEQAGNFLRALPPDPGALPPAVDLELAGNCSQRPDRAWLDRELGEFLAQVERATGRSVVLYIGDDFEGRYRVRDELDRPLWHRRVLARPDVEGWWIWQVHGNASVDGIPTDVDLDVMRGDPRPPAAGRGHR